MSHYSENPAHCRVDIFKPSGKWYMTITLDLTGLYEHNDIHEAIKMAGGPKLELDLGWTAVCLDPYHQHSHPIMLKG